MASPTYLGLANEILANSSKAEQYGIKLTTIDLVGGIHCHICSTIFKNKKVYDTHYILHETGTGIVYTCVVCHKSFNRYPSFRGHCYTNHVMKAKYKCEHCKKQFSKLTALKNHINIMHKFICTPCGKEFQTKKELQIHKIIHNNSDSPPYKCQSCQRKIDSLDGCEYHIDLHSSFTYSCPICSENSNSKQTVVEHLKKHFDGAGQDKATLEIVETLEDEFIEKLGGILCSVCSTVHNNRVTFDAHFSLMHGSEDIVYTCKECSKQFDKYSVFGSHCYDHCMKNRFECEHCSKTFPRMSRLTAHKELYHVDLLSTSSMPLQCPRCEQQFTKQKALQEHLREQHNITCVQCPHEGCERIFETPKELVFHQRQHDNSENWCRRCGLVFSTRASCEKHIDAHRKKSFSCPICNKNYGEKHLVIKHLPKHFEDVVHICKVCGMIYNAKNRLIQHIKIHSDVKTYTCSHCGKGFVKPHHLEQHMNIHTGVKSYKCASCPKTFASYANLHKHSRRIHNTNTKDIKKLFTETTNEANSQHSTDTSSSKESNIKLDTEMNKSNGAASTNTSETDLVSYKFEPNDSTMQSGSIDPVVIKKELKIFEAIGDTLSFPEAPKESLVTEQSGSSTSNYPLEYGPEFNNGFHTDGTGFIDFDDHMLPHIDPLLTINNDQPLHTMYVRSIPDYQYQSFDANMNANFDTDKWEPIITKVYQDYACGYEDMVDTSRLSVIF